MADSIPIYRFLDCHAASKTLEAGKFRVGKLSKFNDPFEWRLGFTGISTPKEQIFAENFSTKHRRWLESWMGMLCFSDTVSDPVPWSLYADKHQGVAFEVVYPWKDNEILKMTYSKERPVLDFNQLRKLRKLHDKRKKDIYLLSLLYDLMIQKSTGWSFEHEYRLSIDLNDRKRCRFHDGHHDWLLPDNSLKRVILGFCCPLDEAAVRKLLDMNGFTETKVARAKMCQETYSIIV